MATQAQRSGEFTLQDDAAYNGKLVAMFFSAMLTLCIVAASAAIIVSATVGHPTSVQTLSAMPGMGPAATVPASAATVPPVVHITIAGSVKMGPDGKMHDAFSVTNYAVHVGQPMKLVINNTDSSAHSITAPAAGVNIIATPGVHTYTLVVSKTGRFLWYCAIPCDSDAHGWAMVNPGFMSGYITAT